MTTSRHVIRRQVLELHVADERDARVVQDQCGDIFHRGIVPLIERFCDQLCEPDQNVRIDTLTLDLGLLDRRHLEDQLLARVTAELQRQLTLPRGAALRPRTADASPGASPNDAPVTPPAVTDNESRARPQDPTASQLELLACFARTGRLPWWADRTENDAPQQALSHCLRQAPAALRRLVATWHRTPAPLRRLVGHCDDPSLAALAKVLLPTQASRGLGAWSGQLLTCLARVEKSSTSGQLREDFWELLLRVSGRASLGNVDSKDLLFELLLELAGRLRSNFAQLVAAVREAAGELTVVPALRAALDEVARRIGLTGSEQAAELGRQNDGDQGVPAREPQSSAGWSAQLIACLSRAVTTAPLGDLHPDVWEPLLRVDRRVSVENANTSAVLFELLREMAAGSRCNFAHLVAAVGQAARELSVDPALRAALDEVARRIGLTSSEQAAELGRQNDGDQGLPTREPQSSAGWASQLIACLSRAATTDPLGDLGADVWEPLLQFSGRTSRGNFENSSVLFSLLREMAGRLRCNFAQLVVAVRQAAAELSVDPALRAALHDVARRTELPRSQNAAELGLDDVADHDAPTLDQPTLDQPTLDQPTLDQPTLDQPTLDQLVFDHQFSDSDVVYLDNAGLVILWPFLESFFRRLELLDERQFRDPAAAQRAAGLLEFLATQDAQPVEYRLPLCKLLCGLPLDALFNFGPPLTETEREESADLLGAVIQQAPILRAMSTDSFRGTFLIRPGILSECDDGMLLRVERQTYDVVLERFPWSFSWVKLPWMAAPLRVDW